MEMGRETKKFPHGDSPYRNGVCSNLRLILSKPQILTLYLNHVEWGRGVFGAEAAARHYFQKPASQLSAWEAARLAVMLPRPRYFEKLPQSAYLSDRAQTIMARMNDVALP